MPPVDFCFATTAPAVMANATAAENNVFGAFMFSLPEKLFLYGGRIYDYI